MQLRFVKRSVGRGVDGLCWGFWERQEVFFRVLAGCQLRLIGVLRCLTSDVKAATLRVVWSCGSGAMVAHLLPKQRAAGSNPVSRSNWMAFNVDANTRLIV